jgi:4-diphosphocytidyl-2-C-methyl-D-erythritol kinase
LVDGAEPSERKRVDLSIPSVMQRVLSGAFIVAFFGKSFVMSHAVEIFPPAKLNLHLEVLGKRADGFHELETVMMAIDLRDRMRITSTASSEITVDCRWIPHAGFWKTAFARADAENEKSADQTQRSVELPPPRENLVYRTLSRFVEVFEIERGFQVTLEKKIPAGAGLGGASSDAAAALLAAAKLCRLQNETERIREIAAEMGSDIPFFMGHSSTATSGSARGYSAAIARGRGEILEPLPAIQSRHFIVLYPPQPLSTAAVFARCRPAAEPRPASRLAAALRTESTGKLSASMFNRLTDPARNLSRWVDESLRAVRLVGLDGGNKTGSGSACIAMAPSATVAQRACRRLAARGLGACFATKTVELPAPGRFLT